MFDRSIIALKPFVLQHAFYLFIYFILFYFIFILFIYFLTNIISIELMI